MEIKENTMIRDRISQYLADYRDYSEFNCDELADGILALLCPKFVWTEDWPKEEGDYWFYGYAYQREFEDTILNKNGKRKQELNMIQVRKISNGFVVIRNGNFWYESEKGPGLFTRMITPNTQNLHMGGVGMNEIVCD